MSGGGGAINLLLSSDLSALGTSGTPWKIKDLVVMVPTVRRPV